MEARRHRRRCRHGRGKTAVEGKKSTVENKSESAIAPKNKSDQVCGSGSKLGWNSPLHPRQFIVTRFRSFATATIQRGTIPGALGGCQPKVSADRSLENHSHAIGRHLECPLDPAQGEPNICQNFFLGSSALECTSSGQPERSTSV